MKPFAYAHITWSETNGELIYRVVEPELNQEEEEIYERLVDSLIELVDIELSSVANPEEAMDYLQDKIKQIIEELNLEMTKTEFAKIMYHIYRNFIGLNKIEAIMHDPYIEDIGADGVNIPLYVIHKKFGSIKTNIVYDDEEKFKDFIVKLAERCGRYISYGEPLLDGSLPDGSRVQATYSRDVSTKGPNFSIRKFNEEPFSPIDMIDLGTASAELLAYLWFCLENDTSALICGGVASGKTSFLNAISLFLPPQEKIVSIEDTRELNLPHENWIPSKVRSGFGMPSSEGRSYGEVQMYDLLRASFRQNPDYIIVGEVRGEEAYVMFQGMSSGHPAMATMHADGVETVVKRLESPPIELPPTLVETLDLVVTMTHAKEKGESDRRVKDVNEIRNIDKDTGEANTNEVFAWIPANDQYTRNEGSDYTLTKISRNKGYELDVIKEEIKTRKKLLQWMHKNGISDWKEVSKLVTRYTRNPNELLNELDIDIESKMTKSFEGIENKEEKEKASINISDIKKKQKEETNGSRRKESKKRPGQDFGKLPTTIKIDNDSNEAKEKDNEN